MSDIFFVVIIGFVVVFYKILDKISVQTNLDLKHLITHDSEIYCLITAYLIAIVIATIYKSFLEGSGINPKKALEIGLNNPSFAKYHQERDDDSVNLLEISANGGDPLKSQKQKSKKKANLGTNKNAMINMNNKGEIVGSSRKYLELHF